MASILTKLGETMDANRIAMVTSQFEPISLQAINERASLQTRADNKYFVPWRVFVAFTQTLSSNYFVMDINGKRAFTYDTQYFDTPALTSYWGHVQGRRKRFKTRSRHYVDSGLCFFELKLKSGRGETVKHKIAYSEDEWADVSAEATTFLQARLHNAYNIAFTQPMVPTLRTHYERVTVVALDSKERVTCDLNLKFGTGDTWHGQMLPDHVLIETKSERGRGNADQLLWHLGSRPARGSKYCLGMSLVRPELRANPFQHVRKSYFVRNHELQVEHLPARPIVASPPHTVPDVFAPTHLPLPSTAAALFEQTSLALPGNGGMTS